MYKIRVDRGSLSHILFQDVCIFCIQSLKRLWYAKVLSERLATTEQYRMENFMAIFTTLSVVIWFSACGNI